jgi:peptide/nickel transport system substrate-binding protein
LFATGSVDNVTGFSDPVVDDLLNRAAAEPDPNARVALLGQAEAEILLRVPIVGLAQFQLLSVASDDVHGLALEVGGTFDPTQVWLAT